MQLVKVTRRILCCGLLALLFGACASEYDRLNQRYDLVSRQIQTLESELKSMVTVEEISKEYLKVRASYQRKIEKLIEARSQSDAEGIAIGQDIDVDIPPENVPQLLKNNYDQISDKIYQLKQIRNDIVKRQTALETSRNKP